MKTVLYTLLAAIAIVSFTVALMVFGGFYNFAADQPHWSLTEKVISVARHQAVERRGADITVPDDLSSRERLLRAAPSYDEMCSGCHLAPGTGGTALRDGLYPVPPDFTRHGIHDPGGAFWVIKHGLKMSGMPAWGQSHDDEALWDQVALLSVLPELSQEEWRTLLQQAEETGHTHHH
ncbi:c-type cytochrome [Alloalcanivorax xenomutans]|uniref:Cytochrome c n=1 Tax=Alloalcanivorax xenomutans TaxID=1094342 RepID=A0A9Q3W2M7_9GAMM|nr:cytochrome c [Alloalcanivorax xenomutans]ARB47404.1 cytochrome C [Alloalcanivorax xenomutans]MCE7508151.1 cytochrome c [Alloalcanivorax xenomutans]MCE7523412.1 cytochrome c [Alloalcanivorax xenomutans]WOD28117.1 cytochrome c [Alloalcanivorax xenomutans]